MRDAVTVPRAALEALFAGFDDGVWVRTGRGRLTAAALAGRDELYRCLHGDVETGGDAQPSSTPDQQPRPAALTEGGPSATPAGGLRGCPFCGGGQPRLHGPAATGHHNLWRVVCSLCYSAGASCYGENEPRERAIAAWNRRAK